LGRGQFLLHTGGGFDAVLTVPVYARADGQRPASG
jgi:hypothetical protein